MSTATARPAPAPAPPAARKPSRRPARSVLPPGEWKALLLGVAVFTAFYFVPFESARLDAAVGEALGLTREYAREHVLFCLVPAFFIAGAIATFVRRGAVLRLMGPAAPRAVAYGTAAVSGTLLAVCSCTVLPLFTGIYAAGAGLGPAAAFLYSGPAINVMAIVLTARVLGLELGLARAVAAVGFAVVIGLVMAAAFRRDETRRTAALAAEGPEEDGASALPVVLLLVSLVGILVAATWGAPAGPGGAWAAIHAAKWWITAGFGLALGLVLVARFGLAPRHLAAVAGITAAVALAAGGRPELPFVAAVAGLSWFASRDEGELGEWFLSSWSFARLIMPLLLAGILVAGFLLGRPGHEGLVPSEWVAAALGGEGALPTALASVAGTLMYFATLTEVPILQGLLGAGMGDGPALALLLAGPALSLPSILVIRSVLGWKKTLVFVAVVAAAATAAGLLYGWLA
ncbi:MAG: permease [Gemmatimonadota bacterium]|nr:permease [Gemmatimonadota bacterium]